MYDPTDFASHPAKYKRFATARVVDSIFTENGSNDLRAGEIVSLGYVGTSRNQMFRRMEPVYSIHLHNGAFWGHLFGHNLTEFCL